MQRHRSPERSDATLATVPRPAGRAFHRASGRSRSRHLACILTAVFVFIALVPAVASDPAPWPLRLRPHVAIQIETEASPSSAGQPDGHDHSGTIVIGHGRPGLVHEFDFFVFDSPQPVTGFDYTGDLRYTIEPISFGKGFIYRVVLVGPLGTHDLHFTLDWVAHGPSDVVFASPVALQTNCVDPLCLQ